MANPVFSFNVLIVTKYRIIYKYKISPLMDGPRASLPTISLLKTARGGTARYLQMFINIRYMGVKAFHPTRHKKNYQEDNNTIKYLSVIYILSYKLYCIIKYNK